MGVVTLKAALLLGLYPAVSTGEGFLILFMAIKAHRIHSPDQERWIAGHMSEMAGETLSFLHRRMNVI